MTTIEKIRAEIEERMHEICNTRSGRVAKRNMSEYETLRNLLDLVNPFLGISGPTYTESCGIPTTSPKYKLDVKKDWHKENASHGAFALTQNEIDFYYKKEQPVEGLDKARFLEVLDQWEEHAIRGMRNGATAYHQGKIALITDLRDWINGED